MLPATYKDRSVVESKRTRSFCVSKEKVSTPIDFGTRGVHVLTNSKSSNRLGHGVSISSSRMTTGKPVPTEPVLSAVKMDQKRLILSAKAIESM